MLSYRHAFHAGNHADVLKHTLLIQLSRYLALKDTPYWVIDTHAGAGRYALDSGYATRLDEYREGIGRLWARDDLPPPVADYVERVRACNPGASNALDSLRVYPGSPWLAFDTLRSEDRLRLFEMHPSDYALLEALFAGHRRVRVAATSGYAALKSLLPPPPRRALVLIDPPYETREDYTQVVASLEEGLTRFPGGTYAVWHPLLARAEARRLPEALKRLPAKSWLHATLTVCSPRADGFGMHGSGMFVINPPWTLREALAPVLPYLAHALAQDAGAGFSLDAHGT